MTVKITSLRATLLLATTVVLAGNTCGALADPPLRAGRLSYVEGNVSFHTLDTNQWVPATLNLPVSGGAWFWTDGGSRAEIEIGPAAIHMDQGTELGVLRLDQETTQLQLPQGVVNVSLQALPIGGMQIETPRGEVSLLRPGTYHLEAVPSGWDPTYAELQLTVLAGEARIDGPGVSLPVRAGGTVSVSGNPARVAMTAAVPTAFDDWALDRDRQRAAALASQYVSPYMTGYQDLDAYGRWTTYSDYGPVWFPTSVAAGWAPYRYGHWAFIPPWGWTWIDDAPWGFAPFHYGRWAFIHGAWGWCPGERVHHPVYAPALVAFIGGTGWNVTVTVGESRPAVGWVPLGPREAFHPYYSSSVEYLHEINRPYLDRVAFNRLAIDRNRDRDEVSRYRNFQGATVVPTNAFIGADPVQRHIVAVHREQFARARGMSLQHLEPTPAARAGGRPERTYRTTRSLNRIPATTDRNRERRTAPARSEAERIRTDTRREATQRGSLGSPATAPTRPGGLQTQPAPTPARDRRETEHRRQPANSPSSRNTRERTTTAPAAPLSPTTKPRPIENKPSGFLQQPPAKNDGQRRSLPAERSRTPAAPRLSAPATARQRTPASVAPQHRLSKPAPAATRPAPSRPPQSLRSPAAPSGGFQTQPSRGAAPATKGTQDRQPATQGSQNQGFGTEPRKRRYPAQDN